MPSDQHGKPDGDALVAELRAKVDERRREGEYPSGLEDDLTAHFERLLSRRLEAPGPIDLRGPLGRIEAALPLRADRIPVASQVPVGAVLHKAVAKLVGRQTQGVLEQVQAFADPVRVALESLTIAVEDLTQEIRENLTAQVSAVVDRQAAQERRTLAAQPNEQMGPHSSLRFEDAFPGSREDRLERYRDLSEHLTGCSPVFQMGCGRGEFLEFLSGLGIETSGVDLDPDLVEAASGKRLVVEHGDGFTVLSRLPDASLGGLVLFQVVEHMTLQDALDIVDLASTKVRTGGRVVIETMKPRPRGAMDHAPYLFRPELRPAHPAYVVFLFKEAGFASVEIEWRSPSDRDVLDEVVDESASASTRRQLNQLLFAPQDYLLIASR